MSAVWPLEFLTELRRLSDQNQQTSVALVLTAADDHNGALTDAGMQFFLLTMAKTHRVVMQTVRNIQEIQAQIQQYSATMGWLIFNAHGTASDMGLSSGQRFTEQDIARLQPLLSRTSSVYFNSCSTGGQLAPRFAAMTGLRTFAPLRQFITAGVSYESDVDEVSFESDLDFFAPTESNLTVFYGIDHHPGGLHGRPDYQQSLRLYMESRARAGDKQAKITIGYMLQCAGDLAGAQKIWLQVAAKHGENEVIPYLVELSRRQNDPEAQAAWQQLQDHHQDAQAQYHVGLLFTRPGKEDRATAIFWLRKAARQYLGDAQIKLASLLEQEAAQGNARALVEEQMWLWNAAELGETGALSLLVELSRRQNDVEAQAAWQQLLDHPQDAQAQYRVGLLFTRPGRQRLVSATVWLQKAARQNLEPAQIRLASLLESAAEWGNISVCHLLASLSRALNDDAAERAWRQLEDLPQDAQAQYDVGLLFTQPGKENQAAALFWMQKAADQGLRAAQIHLGQLFEEGGDLSSAHKLYFKMLKNGDFSVIEQFIRLSVQQHHTDAERGWRQLLANPHNVQVQCDVARLFSHLGQEYRPIAIFLLQQSNQTEADLQFLLASLLEEENDPRNQALIFSLYRLAASQRNTKAEFCYARLLERDDLNEAKYWYSQAGQANHTEALFRLGELYEDEDLDRAVRYYEDAAVLGHVRAQAKLGALEEARGHHDTAEMWRQHVASPRDPQVIYRIGNYLEGVGRHFKNCFTWYQFAADRGHEIAQGRLRMSNFTWRNPAIACSA